MRYYELKLITARGKKPSPELTFWVACPSRKDLISCLNIDYNLIHSINQLPITHYYATGLDATLPAQAPYIRRKLEDAQRDDSIIRRKIENDR